ncbi:hypothetical protein ABZS79_27715 [Streptomyces griseoloalbus]|uniref:hypothetical protein n=1 Tax=Streptomyces griseoloalbus TaxID=67303 RepID=UPI0033AD03BE
MTAATRTEHDLLGDRDVPAEAYWGVHTLRATENFPEKGLLPADTLARPLRPEVLAGSRTLA